MSSVRRAPDRPPKLAQRRAVERLLTELPEKGAIPRRDGELAFEAPWEVRALGMAVELHQEGHFPWSALQSELVAVIQQWEEASPGKRTGWSYYRHFARALEHVAARRGLVDAQELDLRTNEFLAGRRDPRHR